MSKKHFEALAKALKQSQPYSDQNGGAEMIQWMADVSNVADTCELFNVNFDRARFLKACGVEV